MKINKGLILALFSVLFAQLCSGQSCGGQVCSGLLSGCCTNAFTGQSQCYNPLTHSCCDNKILCAITDACCGNTCFNPSQYFCCESSQAICQLGSTNCCPGITPSTTGGSTGGATGSSTGSATTGSTTGGGPSGNTVVTREYVLMATDGYIQIPTGSSSNPSDISSNICLDNNSQRVYVWGYVGGLWKINNVTINQSLDYTNTSNWDYLMSLKGTASIPSPIISGAVGERIYIHVINLGFSVVSASVPHTFTIANANLPSQLDGFQETSVGIPMWNNTSVVPPVITYFWLPQKPGTFPYYCPVDFGVHIQMGMYGAAVVYPSASSVSSFSDTRNWKFAYANELSRFDQEYVFILSELDLFFHSTVESGNFPDFSSFRPTFFLLNGRVFPQTLLNTTINNTVTTIPNTVNGVDANLLQLNRLTYDTFINMSRSQQSLIRIVNVGFQTALWRSVGGSMKLLGKDSVPDTTLLLANLLNDNSLLASRNLIDIPSTGSADVLLSAANLSSLYADYLVSGLDGFPSLCQQVATVGELGLNWLGSIPVEAVCNSTSGNSIVTTNLLDMCNELASPTSTLSGVNRLYPQWGKLFNAWWIANNNGGNSPAPGGQLTYFRIN